MTHVNGKEAWEVNEKWLPMRCGVSFWDENKHVLEYENVLKLIVVVTVQLCEYTKNY